MTEDIGQMLEGEATVQLGLVVMALVAAAP
jgi:hypothetical protein